MGRQIRSAIGAGSAGRLHARAVVVAANGGWRTDVELAVGDQRSVRAVEGETCRAVADAVAVIVALAASPEVAPPAVLPPPPPPSAPVDAVAPVAPAPPPFALGAAFLLDEGTLPKVGYGAEAIAGFRLARLELEIVADVLAPERGNAEADAAEGAKFWMAGFGIRGCYALLVGRLDLAPCAAVHGEWLVGSGFAERSPETSAAGTGALALGGRGTLRVTRLLALRLGLEADVPLVRATFEIQKTPKTFASVYSRSVVAGRVFLGPALTF